MPHRYLLALGETPAQGDPYEELDDWLRSAAVHNVQQPRLCHVLRAAGPAGPPEPEPDGDEVAPAHVRRARSRLDIPWVTLVLGSECLEIQPRAFDADALLAAVLRDLMAQGDARSAHLVHAFVKALIAERLGDLVATASGRRAEESAAETLGSAPEAPSLSPWTLRLVEATAVLNSLYFQAKTVQSRAVSRWNAGVIPLLGAPGHFRDERHSAEVPDRLAADVRRLGSLLYKLGEELKQVKADAVPIDVGHLRELVERLRASVTNADLGAPVNVADVQAMTEITWATLVLDTEVYPTWPELLVDLCLQQGSRGIRSGTPRPSFRHVSSAEGHLRKLLMPASVASERAYVNGHNDNPRDEAYRQYARLLVAQSSWLRQAADYDVAVAAAAQYPEPDGRADGIDDGRPEFTPLLSTAFVTTFDVELEMALRSRYPDQPFVVAVPVHFVHEKDVRADRRERATSLWLGYVVSPSERGLLEAVTRPQDEDWFVLSSANLKEAKSEDSGPHLRALEEGHSLSELPFVIRLSGSPLVQLPDLEDSRGGWKASTDHLRRRALALARSQGELRAGGRRPTAARMGDPTDEGTARFAHAPLLEEHHSLRLSLPEIEVSGNSARGLPRDLTRLAHGSVRRYWLLLGVQLSDSVVRLRLMAQFFSAGLMHGEVFNHPERSGMALNGTRLTARATDLLEWSEFDLVGGDLERMSAHLGHYSDHLATARGATTWPTNVKECEIR